MSNQNKLIPELRFPEFVKDGEWKREVLGNLLNFQTGFPFDSQGFNENEIGVRLIKNKDLKSEGKKVFYNKPFDEKYLVNDGDVLIGMDGDFTPSVWQKGKALLNQRVGRIIANVKEQEIFYFYFLSIHLKTIEEKTARTTVKHLSHTDVEKIYEPLPKPIEQQKIATCLSSLDVLLTAHTDKLETLKTYKKGLMQNLFPQEGEKAPKFRFKEFEKDGDWAKDRLGDIGNPSMCKRIFKEETTSDSKNGIPFYKIGTFGKEADSYISKVIYEEYKRKYSFPKKGDILISASGTIGRLVVYDGKPAFFQDSNIVWIDNDESKIINRLLFYAYSLLNWQTSDGGIIQRLYNADLKGMIIRYPKNKQEQQKIADTLTSLDTLIKEQTDKIAQLKLHKKGLMQGLFPKMKN